MMSNIAGLYFTHYECFGHTSRVAAFVGALKKKFPKRNFFFIQGGKDQPVSGLDHWGPVYSLSRPYADRKNFKCPVIVDPAVSVLRARECLNILGRERPDIFVTEYFPIGRSECRDELLPVLIELYRQHVPLFSISGYPLLTGVRGRWMDLCLRLYQKAFIFSPQIEMEYIAKSLPSGIVRREYLDFFKKNAQKVIFTGYLPSLNQVVTPGEEIVRFQRKGVRRIAVVRGGGAYYPQIITTAIRASDVLGDGYEFILVAGPSTTDAEWRVFSKLIGRKKVNNARLVRRTSAYDQLISESDVCVCPAPYHTALSLLKHVRRAVIIPFEGYGGSLCFREQPARARILADHIRSEILRFEQLSAKSLAAALCKVLKKDMSRVKVPVDWFEGGAVAFKEVQQAINSRGRND